MIIATAGHVDHGKTELIKALTGTDTDRLPEEKARGLSLDLGFAYHKLPGGDILGFVDVPGHEKFIHNMLAGVAGIDLGLLVIAADDGVMPQTREHLFILNLLGINNFVVALTKIDRASRERILEVSKQIKSLLNEIGHSEYNLYPVCAPKGIGILALMEALRMNAKDITTKCIDGYFRMAIDRAFNLKGIGLIVTGTVFSGKVYTSENLTHLPSGIQVRIREMRVHNQRTDRAKAGERCALHLSGRGLTKDLIRRGNWLAGTDLQVPTRRIDVELHVLKTETNSLKHWTPTHLHIGSDRMSARVAVLSGGYIGASQRGLAQLVLQRDAFVVHGDRFVLRDQSAKRTIAGGRVVDPFSPKRGRARPSRIETLMAMSRKTTAEILEALVENNQVGVDLPQFSISHNLPTEKIYALVTSLGLRRVGKFSKERIFCEVQWKALNNRIMDIIIDFHKSKPNLLGASLKDISSPIMPFICTDATYLALKNLISEKRLAERSNRYYLPTHNIHIPDQVQELLQRAALVLAPNSGAPPTLHEAAEQMGVKVKDLEKTLKLGESLGDFVLIKKNRYVPKSLINRLKNVAKKLASDSNQGIFTLAEYRKEVNMGRNFVIAILEYFDQLSFTKRMDNSRRLVRSFTSIQLSKGRK